MYRKITRVVNGALSARKIITRTPMGNKVLRSGNTILIPFRQLHYNKNAFGNNPGTFSPNRFLKEKYLKNSWSFKPFGGGVNYCPGRFLAKQEMLYFVALFLHRSDFEFAQGSLQGEDVLVPQNFPRLDEYTPALGVNGPVKGSNVYITLQERKL